MAPWAPGMGVTRALELHIYAINKMLCVLVGGPEVGVVGAVHVDTGAPLAGAK